MSKTMETVPFPDIDHRWWWMRCKVRPRGKWRVLLVEVIEHEGTKYVQPHEDNNCYPREIAEQWQAQFVPTDGPPADSEW